MNPTLPSSRAARPGRGRAHALRGGSALRLLRRLARHKGDFDAGSAALKLRLLQELEGRRLRRAESVLELHEILCFLRAYPDDAALLQQIERMLESFSRRADLRRHRKALADSGIAGTELQFRYFYPTASWLARHWPEQLGIDWDAFENSDRLDGMLHLLALYGETPGLDEFAFPVRDWVELLAGPNESDAAFLARRFDALRMPQPAREALYDSLDVPIRIRPAPGTPSRTRAHYASAAIVYQTRPLSRGRPEFPGDILRSPHAVRALSRREGQALIDLARAAMVTRSRDLDAFAYGDPTDVRLVDCGEGLQFACIGQIPERRLLLESVYGYLTLKNGVPIGYVLSSALFGSAEVAYNVFETYRGAEAARIYGRVLATVHRLFGSDSFAIDPFQLGHDNHEALHSGAWWFYQKLGFRPREADLLRRMRTEKRRMRAEPRHRSSLSTLRELSEAYMFYSMRRPRDDVLGIVPLARIGLHVSHYVATRFGADREGATRVCAREATTLLGLRSTRAWSPGERLAWDRWSPLVLILPGVHRWSAEQRRALAAVVRAKGSKRESDYVHLFDRHLPLRRALLRLAHTRSS